MIHARSIWFRRKFPGGENLKLEVDGMQFTDDYRLWKMLSCVKSQTHSNMIRFSSSMSPPSQYLEGGTRVSEPANVIV